MKMVRDGRFLEWAEVHGHLYGSAIENLQQAGEDEALLFEVDCNGARQIRERIKEAISIFIMTPSFQDLVSRIKNRGGMTEPELQLRIRRAKDEVRQLVEYDYLVINDDFSTALQEIKCICIAERCRSRYRIKYWMEKWLDEAPDL